LRQDNVWAALVIARDQLVDPLSRAFEFAGGFGHREVVFADGFDNRHIRVVVAHSPLWAGSVNDVSTDLSTITCFRQLRGSVSDVLTDLSTITEKTPVPKCQLSPDSQHCLGHFVISRDIVDTMSRDMVDRYRRVVGTVFFPRGGICFYLLLFLFKRLGW